MSQQQRKKWNAKPLIEAAQKTAGAIGRTGKAAYQAAASARSQAQTTQSTTTIDIEPSSKTFYDGFTSLLIQIIGLVAPLLISAVLTVGNGYFFSGFHLWNTSDPLTVVAYIGGGVLEAVGLGLVYRAARRYRKQDYKGMIFTMIWLIILMSVSIFAQYMFLQGLYSTGALRVPDNAAEHAPLFSMLVGVGAMRGHDIVFFVRAIAFHVGELACSFVVVDKSKTATQIIAERREIHDAQIAMERQELQLDRERDEARQDAEIKRLQHQWLLAQVRQGVVYVSAETPQQQQIEQPKWHRPSEDPNAPEIPPAQAEPSLLGKIVNIVNGLGDDAIPAPPRPPVPQHDTQEPQPADRLNNYAALYERYGSGEGLAEFIASIQRARNPLVQPHLTTDQASQAGRQSGNGH